MGLDNGITLHSTRPIPIPKELVRVYDDSQYEKTEDYPYAYSICYWRKCWNIRRAIALALGTDMEDASKDGLTISDIKNIWHAINYLNCKKVWDEGDSLWTYKEIRDNLDESLHALEWLINIMRYCKDGFLFGEMRLEFYDSY